MHVRLVLNVLNQIFFPHFPMMEINKVIEKTNLVILKQNFGTLLDQARKIYFFSRKGPNLAGSSFVETIIRNYRIR